MNLRYDPLAIFKSSKTSAGLYARKKWRDEGTTPKWLKDYNQTVAALFAGQSDDGSWRRSEIETIRRLFGLHLTVRSQDHRINAALNWLIDRMPESLLEHAPDPTLTVDGARLRQLPFTPSPPEVILVAATLFLASLFGRENDPAIVSAYGRLSDVGLQNRGVWFDQACSCNLLRALVVHPLYCHDIATVMAVEKLAEIQQPAGDWGNKTPFYLTANALAHLNIPQADQQLEKAFERLHRTQHKDGSWNQAQPEWHTFLAVHALKNKGMLTHKHPERSHDEI